MSDEQQRRQEFATSFLAISSALDMELSVGFLVGAWAALGHLPIKEIRAGVKMALEAIVSERRDGRDADYWISRADWLATHLRDTAPEDPGTETGEWSASYSESIRHKLAVRGSIVATINEYGSGRCWARLESPEEVIGSFPDLRSAREAVASKLRDRGISDAY